jgi:glyoxylase-like metal-dependent hydrolase (beta-lactamase superfamily II)
VSAPLDEVLFDQLDAVATADVDSDDAAFGRRAQHLMTSFFSIGILFDPEPEIAEPVEILRGVIQLPSRASSVVVHHSGGVVVLEAPGSPANGVALLEAVGDLAPGQAVTHLVQSHHHVDHASGVRSFAAAGATVVVGSGAGAFWDEVLVADSIVEPDLLSTSPGEDVGALDEVADGSSTVLVDDGDVVVTAHHTPTPHAADMLTTTIETGDAIVVYQADTYNAGTGLTLALPGPQILFDDLRSLGYLDEACASPVPMTIVPSHGVPQSLEASLAELDRLGIDVGCA